MKEKELETTTVDLAAGPYGLRATATRTLFDGFAAVYTEGRDDGEDDAERTLPPLAVGDATTRRGGRPDAALHRAAAALHGGEPDQGPRGERDRPPVHVRGDDLHDRRSRLRRGPRAAAPPGAGRRGRHGPPGRPFRRVRRSRVHGPDGGGARRGRPRRTRLGAAPRGVLRAAPRAGGREAPRAATGGLHHRALGRGLLAGPSHGDPAGPQRPLPRLLALPGAQGVAADPRRGARGPGAAGHRRGLPDVRGDGRRRARREARALRALRRLQPLPRLCLHQEGRPAAARPAPLRGGLPDLPGGAPRRATRPPDEVGLLGLLALPDLPLHHLARAARPGPRARRRAAGPGERRRRALPRVRRHGAASRRGPGARTPHRRRDAGPGGAPAPGPRRPRGSEGAPVGLDRRARDGRGPRGPGRRARRERRGGPRALPREPRRPRRVSAHPAGLRDGARGVPRLARRCRPRLAGAGSRGAPPVPGRAHRGTRPDHRGPAPRRDPLALPLGPPDGSRERRPVGGPRDAPPPAPAAGRPRDRGGRAAPRRGRRRSAARRPRPEPGRRRGRRLRPRPLRHALALRDVALVETAYAAGLRISELAGARLGALDLSRGEIRVAGKGRKERIGLLGRPARSALGAYLADGRPALLARGGDGPRRSDALFINHRGAPLGGAGDPRIGCTAPRSGPACRTTRHRIPSGTRSPRTSSTAAPTCASCRSSSVTPTWRRRRSTPTSPRGACGASTAAPTPGPGKPGRDERRRARPGPRGDGRHRGPLRLADPRLGPDGGDRGEPRDRPRARHLHRGLPDPRLPVPARGGRCPGLGGDPDDRGARRPATSGTGRGGSSPRSPPCSCSSWRPCSS